MKLHPAVLMLLVWLGGIAIFFILPFQLEEGRVMTLYGFLILALFIAVFCGGALAAARPQPQRPRKANVTVDFRLTDRVLITAGVIAVLASLMDVQGRNVLDLADAYQARSDRAGALMAGSSQSDSTIWFQIAFLTYPASYVYIVREVGFRARPLVWRLVLFGLAPAVLSALAMGGRSPLLYALMMLIFGFGLRKYLFKQDARKAMVPRARTGSPATARRKPFKLGAAGKAGVAILVGAALVYFVQVFFTRADVVGGVDTMFGVASTSWGVNFNGRFSDIIFGVFGPDGAYLIFIFAWYMVQGLLISNVIFTEYDGAMLFGGYGIDLVSALMRRVNGDFLGQGYAVLLDLNTYGFFPSAFGALYVDLGLFGLIPCLIWGWLAGKVYGKIKLGEDPRWLLIAPFVVLGVSFSLINTPIGFSNGFVTHIWMVVAFLTARPLLRQPAGAATSARAPQR